MERFIHLWCGLLYCITYANIYSIQLIVHSCTRYRCISEAITWIHLQAIPALSRSLRLIIANKYIIIQILWYSNSCANCVQPSFRKNKKKKKKRESIDPKIFIIYSRIDFFHSHKHCSLLLKNFLSPVITRILFEIQNSISLKNLRIKNKIQEC